MHGGNFGSILGLGRSHIIVNWGALDRQTGRRSLHWIHRSHNEGWRSSHNHGRGSGCRSGQGGQGTAGISTSTGHSKLPSSTQRALWAGRVHGRNFGSILGLGRSHIIVNWGALDRQSGRRSIHWVHRSRSGGWGRGISRYNTGGAARGSRGTRQLAEKCERLIPIEIRS